VCVIHVTTIFFDKSPVFFPVMGKTSISGFGSDLSGGASGLMLGDYAKTGYEIGYKMNIENHIPHVCKTCNDQFLFNV
jgi:hypothetical protein